MNKFLPQVGFGVFLCLLGLALLRNIFPALIWYVAEYLSLTWLLALALATVIGGPVLARVFLRWVSARAILMIFLSVTGASTVALSISDSATLDAFAAVVGTAAWAGTVLLVWGRHGPLAHTGPNLGLALSAAFVIDTTAMALLRGNPLVFEHRWWSTLIIAAASIATVWMGARLPSSAPSSHVAPLFVVGPWLLMYFAFTGNQARAWLAGVPFSIVHVFVAVVALVSLGSAAIATANARPWYGYFSAALVAGSGIGIAFLPHWSMLWIVLMSVGMALSATTSSGLGGASAFALASGLVVLLLATLADLYEVPYVLTAVALISAILTATRTWRFRTTPFADDDRTPRSIRRPLFIATASIAVIVVPLGSIPLSSETTLVEKNGGDTGAWTAPGKLPPDFSLVSFNIHQGVDAGLHPNPRQIANDIASAHADVVGLVEVNLGRATNGFSNMLSLIAAAGEYPYVYYSPNSPDGLYGNAIMSRVPLGEAETIPYRARTSEQRSLLSGTVTAGDLPVSITVTHLDHMSGEDNVRGHQTRELLNHLDLTGRNIVMGDFNATPNSAEIQFLVDSGLTDVWDHTGQNDAPTFLGGIADLQPRRIDYVFTTGGIAVLQAQTIDTRSSDHLPLYVDVEAQ